MAEEVLHSLCEKNQSKRNYPFYSGSVIVVDAPPSSQKNKEFVAIDRILQHSQVLVPGILAADITNGFMILEDLGNTLFYQNAVDDERLAFYYKACVTLTKIGMMPRSEEEAARLAKCRQLAEAQNDSIKANLINTYHLDQQDFAYLATLPPFDEAFIRMELGIFSEWMVEKSLQLKLSADEEAMLEQTWRFLVKGCQEQAQVVMHRDLHGRNIMIAPDGCDSSILSKLAVIDFQDMVLGPVGYDVASLLYDCYDVLEDEYRERLLGLIYEVYSGCGVLVPEQVSLEDFKRQVLICALQRHIKVLGIFKRLSLRDGKDGYLKDLPRVLNYVLTNCDAFPEMAPFKAFLVKYVAPHLNVTP